MHAIRAFIAKKRAEHDLLRQNGAILVSERGNLLLLELETLINDAPDPEYTVQEAANISGMNAESIRRGVRGGRYGTQAGKKCTIKIRGSELPLLVPRRRKVQTLDSSHCYQPGEHAKTILTRMGRLKR